MSNTDLVRILSAPFPTSPRSPPTHPDSAPHRPQSHPNTTASRQAPAFSLQYQHVHHPASTTPRRAGPIPAMDFFQKQIPADVSHALSFGPPLGSAQPPPEQDPVPDAAAAPNVHDTITSLMNMADKMEALLPPGCDISLDMDPSAAPALPHLHRQGPRPPSNHPAAHEPPPDLPDARSHHRPPPAPDACDFNARFADCLSSVTGATASFKTEPFKTEPQVEPSSHPAKPLSLDVSSGLDATDFSVDFTARPARPRSLPVSYPCNVTEVSMPAGSPSTQELPMLYGRPPNLPLPDKASSFEEDGTALPVSVSPLESCTSPGTAGSGVKVMVAGSSTSPCAIRDLRDLTDVKSLADAVSPRTALCKTRKTGRKPKTYSKPVASRFCHICSRMPRRGQGSATCRRMAEGFCRKIVCEQCLREQGWNYEDIAANPSTWLCPHCAEICPARSQCHIYNRINARRKRAGPGGAKSVGNGQSASVAAALASSDVLLGPYGHLFNSTQSAAPQILQPPPNFRLNLPPQYSQH